MSMSSSAVSNSSHSEPDFIEFLGDELKATAQEVTMLLGRWLVEYKPSTAYEIRMLEPRGQRGECPALEGLR